MRESLRRIQLVLGVLVLVGAGVVYLQNNPPPGTPGWANCLLLFIILSLVVLLIYLGCIMACGTDPDKPLDPVCQRRCARFLWIMEGLLVVLLFGCLIGAHAF